MSNAVMLVQIAQCQLCHVWPVNIAHKCVRSFSGSQLRWALKLKPPIHWFVMPGVVYDVGERVSKLISRKHCPIKASPRF